MSRGRVAVVLMCLKFKNGAFALWVQTPNVLSASVYGSSIRVSACDVFERVESASSWMTRYSCR